MSESSLTGFFDSASVNRFSICFNHGADGVLGINTPSHLESDMGLYKIVQFKQVVIQSHTHSYT